jgi:hypothetical protein
MFAFSTLAAFLLVAGLFFWVATAQFLPSLGLSPHKTDRGDGVWLPYSSIFSM